MAEWGLHAIITPKDHDHHHHDHVHDHDDSYGSIGIKKEYDQALLFCFPHMIMDHHDHDHDHEVHDPATTMNYTVVSDELDQLYKPFYSVPAAAADDDDGDMQIIHRHYRGFEHDIQQDQEQETKIFSGSAANTSQVAPKLKKRKNQQKRVVVQVTAAGLSADPWAWRKYGQKPIKGSIYPRNYYRCSSSKGCMARRQVEQSCTDSSIYILTYTADHNHPQPTRRNSLAGINRNRLKATQKSPTNCDVGKPDQKSKPSPFHSPTTISASSIEDEVRQQSNIKEETLFYNKCDDQVHTMIPGISDGDDYMVFNDDFFEGLEDLGGYRMESSSYYSSTKQFPHVLC